MSSRAKAAKATREANTRRRAIHVQKRFDYLYEVKRKRIDDCISEIAQELFISESTVEADLKKEV